MTVSTDGFTHSAFVYSSTEEYLAPVLSFVRGGLAAREPVAVAAPTTNLIRIKDALRADAGQVCLLDMTDVGRNPGRILPAVLHSFADPHPTVGVRVVSEPVWSGRTPHDIAACIRHEALINLAFAGRRIAVMCPYSLDHLDRAELEKVYATHPVVNDGSGERPSDRYAPDEVLIAANAALPVPAGAFTMSFDLATLTGVRRTAAEFAQRSGMPERRVHAVEVAASELATNSIKHGGGGGIVRLWIDGGSLICQVDDHGRLDDPLAGRRPVPASQLSGRGLLLVNMVTDLVRTYSGPDGTSVRFHVALAQAARGNPPGNA
ncbi:anti-sigma factor RsbA family regulatory protein [Actinoplanes sp. NPDC049681]|uniref:anti-sigma factor RsbA family regulatory protein n=1 Tax=Actinoplanes sp. NPDC049681 TaxID=3363905 RepID=UPI0037953F45